MRHSALHGHGYAIWSGGDGKPVERDSLQCCHCGKHFWVTPGSGKRRGYCTRCARVTCGSEICNACIPCEQMLENKEKGRPAWYQPAQVHVPVDPPKSSGGIILGS